MSFVAKRVERFQSLITEEELDACLISNPVNVTWLSGFSGDSSYLIIGREKSLIVSDTRYTEQLEEECPGLEAHIRDARKKPLEAVADAMNQLGYRNVGFESNHLTIAQMESLREAFPSTNWKSGADRVENLRMVKDADELRQIREAISIAERAFAVLINLIRPQDTELELCHALQHYVHQAGGRGMAFDPIVAVGPRAALPHAPPTDKKVEESDLLLVDWGATGPFYKSDLTRVLDTRRSENSSRENGAPSVREIYQIVREAQEAAIAAVHPGASAAEVDTAARRVIDRAGYGDYFGHGLGHGFGLEIHELPSIRPRSETILETGMIFTIEPGIYLPGWGGIRLEDDVLVTEEGVEVLTHVDKEMTPIFLNR